MRLAIAAALALFPLAALAADPGESPQANAGDLLAEGDFAGAASAYDDILADKAADHEANLRLGQLALYDNRLRDAETLLKAAIKARPDDAEANILLAEVYYRRDDFAAAAAALKAAGPAADDLPMRANFSSLNLEKLESFGATPGYQISGDTASTTLPFVATDPLPLVRVSVNGGPEVVFFIDTGGAEVIVDTAYAKELGIPQFTPQVGHFAGGKTATISSGKIDSIRLGDYSVANVPVTILDTRAFSEGLGERIDGAIGTIILSRFLSTLDYRKGELRLARAGSDRPTEGSASRFWLTGDHAIVAEGQVDDLPPKLFFVDTGLAGAGVNLREQVIEAAGIALDESKASEGAGGGGTIKSIPYVVPKVSLGEFSEANVNGVFDGPLGAEDLFGFYVQGLVGHEFFRNSTVTFDFVNMQIHIAK